MSFKNTIELMYSKETEGTQNASLSRVKPYLFNAILFYASSNKANGMRYEELLKLMTITFIKDTTNLYMNTPDDNPKKNLLLRINKIIFSGIYIQYSFNRRNLLPILLFCNIH
ncbi:hypothetical protein I862_02965 [endosymbiont of Acanthamoeba sp. UWC8]|uniref:hypothetical protein n=1 Tax=endosymbiont of Acanthamoeba sp. UWC8 TaxID=86106 RepID=UPI0004D18014|nr:hypothetical protein [endosymbiont of Acanthamoeba sp. UWC8]AIF81156.1 hypothetical protein I862_02965 [endosymbiont of Acanthamoeba sp. UWC8]